MIARLSAALLLLAPLTAGCLSQPGGTVDPASAPPVGDPAANLPKTEVFEGMIASSAATPVRTFNFQGAFVQTFTVSKNSTGFVIEVAWSPTTPASQDLSLWIRKNGAGNLPPSDPTELVMPVDPVAVVNGGSPLRIALAHDAFGEEGDFDAIVRAAAQPVGVAVNQPFDIHITSFLDIPFDDEFTALGGA